VLSAYLVKLVNLILFHISNFLREGKNTVNVWWKNQQVCVRIIPDHKSEKVTEIGARLTKLS